VRRPPPLPLGPTAPPVALGVGVAVTGIALTTLLVYPLKHVAPVVALGVLYLLVVLLVSSLWGAWLGAGTALASALAFNYFHIPPTGRLTIAESANWAALGVFFVVAIVASSLAQAARSRASEVAERRTEADLAAEMARLLLRGGDLRAALATAAQRLSAALDLPSAAIEPVDGDGVENVKAEVGRRRIAIALHDGERPIGTLVVPAGLPATTLARLRERVAPALEALLAAALEREALLGDRVETAALRRSDVLKTALLRSVSHDLRSPLTAILTAAEPLAGERIEDADRRELGAIVGEEARRLARLVDNLLDLSRLETHGAPPRPEWCSLEEVVRAAAEGVGVPVDTFQLRMAPDLPPLRADAAQLERAFANLLDNAARHGAGHPVLIRASAVRSRILVRIVDRGPGIAPTEQERIFEPFHRAPGDRAASRGSGLGLAIARGFVEVNGGRVWVESLPGQGASFVVELPIEAAADGLVVAAAPDRSAEGGRSGRGEA
jgi:two-component system, OmpR family, sensor histidine kinase KdpD